MTQEHFMVVVTATLPTMSNGKQAEIDRPDTRLDEEDAETKVGVNTASY